MLPQHFSAFATITQLFNVVTTMPDLQERAVYLSSTDNGWQETCYRDFRQTTISFAGGLHALGIRRGDTVGIAAENSVRWMQADFAIVALGGIDVPVFPTLTAEQERYIFDHSECRAVVVSNQFQLSKVQSIEERLPKLEFIIVLQPGDYATKNVSVLSFDAVVEQGAQTTEEWFVEECNKAAEDDVVTIIYTSGTTGIPKGVMLTNKNLVSNVKSATDRFEITRADTMLSYLPLCHSLERIGAGYTAFATLATVAFAKSIDHIASGMLEVRPTLMTSVPRLFERIYARVHNNIVKESPAKQRIFSWAVKTGMRCVELEHAGRRVPIHLTIQRNIADKLVFEKIRARTGGKLRAFISGGAALPREIGLFFYAIGIDILEGYGLTETAPVLAGIRWDQPCIGTVGPALKDVTLRIAADGEILAKGPNVMKGYFKDEQATAEAIDEEGWFHTGDIGMFDERGNLKITDRKKHIFVSSGGKNIAPQPIENTILQSKFIEQVVLIGEKRDYCSALIVPDFDILKEWAAKQGLQAENSELVLLEQLQKTVYKDVQTLLKDFSKYEKVRRLTLLDEPFTVENGMMTPTLKIKRKVVEERFADIIDEMYK